MVFAGSPARLAEGAQIAGVDVGGLTPSEARRLLARRSAALVNVPVTFFAAGRHWQMRPRTLGVEADWAAAVDAARRQGEGFGPFRGLRRVRMRVFGADIAAPTRVYEPALEYELTRIRRAVDRPHREPAVRLHGLTPVVAPGQTGRLLDRTAAAATIVHALSGLARAPVPLPVRLDRPRVSTDELAPAATAARVALSRPVELTLGPTRWRLPRWRIAELLRLPADGRKSLAIGGPQARNWFTRFSATVSRPAADATWTVTSKGVFVVPARAGIALDVPGTRRALLAAAVTRSPRVARVHVSVARPELTTREAQAMNITAQVGGFETIYGGDPNRIHNVQLVAKLIDKTLIAAGATFSFNETTGERTPEKGFREAPVIINGELQTGLGGGVCQVSTTVFNAAYEAGVKITARTNHALYISHYPTGRDATVNYPDTDLRFVNDTGHWLLLRTFVGSSSLYVGLYGTPTGRRVESETAPLRVTGAVPVQIVRDPEALKGTRVVEEYGEPPRATSVRRRVYEADGKLLYDDVWSSSYRGEKEIVRVGTKAPPPPEKPKKKKPKPAPPEEPPVTGPTLP
jgi:vancomycin resistance protein YoaR